MALSSEGGALFECCVHKLQQTNDADSTFNKQQFVNISRKAEWKTFGVTERDDGGLLLWDHDDSVRQSPGLLKKQLQHVWNQKKETS